LPEDLVDQFVEAAARDDASLAPAALLIARVEYPRLDVSRYLDELDRLGDAARSRIESAGRPTGARGRLECLNHFIFEEQGFTGNQTSFDDPRNSFLNDVLDRRTGIPITLGAVYLEIGRRALVPIQGVNFPGHFLLRADAERGPLVVDPFNGGAFLGEAECRALLARHVGEDAVFDPTMLAPATKRQILLRMLGNLKRAYVRMRSFRHARDVSELLVGLDPGSLLDIRDRGLLAYHLDDFPAALRDLSTYLAQAPRDEEDETSRKELEQIWEHLKALRRRVAGLN
jgi:regulator of sirC expression with transglutaminase-like and TPR domain